MGSRYLAQARDDLRFAELLLHEEGYYLTANLSHQAAENALKAVYWVVRRAEPPWRHNLRHILDTLTGGANDLPRALELSVDTLDPLFGRTRYPSGDIGTPIPSQSISREIADNALHAAREVVSWAESFFASQ